MTLEKPENYTFAEQFLIENGILDDSINKSQYEKEPFEYFSNTERYEHTSFRPSVIEEIEENTEAGRFSTKSGEILETSQLSTVMRYLSNLFEEVEPFSRTSDCWFMDEEINYNELRNLSKVVYTTSEISRKNNPRPGFEEPVAAKQDSLPKQEYIIHRLVEEKNLNKEMIM